MRITNSDVSLPCEVDRCSGSKVKGEAGGREGAVVKLRRNQNNNRARGPQEASRITLVLVTCISEPALPRVAVPSVGQAAQGTPRPWSRSNEARHPPDRLQLVAGAS